DKPDVGGQDKDPALENAEKLVKEAEDAETKAEEALKEANKDGVISQEEKGKLDSLNEEITKAKKDAEDALKDLAEGEIKDDLKERLDNVDNVNVPTVNDSNGNDVANAEQAIKAAKDAEQAIKAAKDAEQAAKDAAANADSNRDGVISPSEAKAVEDANKALEEAKTAAKNAIDAVPAD
ncbi:hypothetical protein QP017_11535, partial [Gallibacterium anatis]